MTALRAGIGTSRVAESAVAGRTAASAAISQLAGEAPALVIVYASVRYDLPRLIAGVRQAAGDATVVGATSSGHFHGGSLTPPGEGVAVLAMTAGPYRFGVGSAQGLRADGFGCGLRLARAARDAAADGPRRSPHSALLVLADGLAGEHQRLLAGAHRVGGSAVPIVGGAAGDDRRLQETFVVHDERVLSDAAVGVWIDAPWPLRAVTGHGWYPVGLPLLVTRSEGVVVHEIAGRPAAEVYHEHFGGDRLCEMYDRVHEPGSHSGHAFGLIEPNGELAIRGAFLDEREVLRTFAPVPPYSAIQIVSCACENLVEVTDNVVRQALAGPGRSVLLAFSCVARLDILAERGGEEATRIQHAAGEARTFGMYTYGEFARTAHASGYHNATLTGIAL